MANKIVGSEDCPILDVVNTIMSASTSSLLHRKWESLAIQLGLGPDVTIPIRDDRLVNKITSTKGVLNTVIFEWVSASDSNNKATLGVLIDALESENLNAMVTLLKAKYYVQQAAPQDQVDVNPSSIIPKTDSIPLEVTPEEIDFIKTIKPFSVTITRPKVRVEREDNYKLPTRFKGLALVINITEFAPAGESRKGATNDTKYMRDLWADLGYDVSVYEGSFTAEDIEKIIQDFTGKIKRVEEEDGVKSCVAFIGSHGEMGSICMSSGPAINVYDGFIYKITGIKELDGKPKFIIVNACQNFPRTSQDNQKLTMPVKDTIVCFSTIPGQPSNRDTYLGSWYVNCLTRVIMKNAHHMHLEEMLSLAQQTMECILAETQKGQLPYHTNWLMKKLYFNMPLA